MSGRPLRLHDWQRLVLDRLLEHDRDGRLCWREAVISSPRQVGKSTLSAVYSLARCVHAAVLGGPQGVLLVSAGLRQATRLHESWWPWAVEEGLKLRKLMDAASINFPDGSWWRLSSAAAIWGATADAAIVDESWAVASSVAEGALQPTMVTRPSAQLILSSTANADASELTLVWRKRALGGSARTMIAEWSAGEGADPADPAVWRAASPMWSRERAELVAAQRGAAGWSQNWLNRWPTADGVEVGWPQGWSACGRVAAADPPAGLVGAVEVSHDRKTYGVAVAALGPGRRLEVWARVSGSLDDALGQLRVWRPASLLAGLTLADAVLGPWQVWPVGVRETTLATGLVADQVRRRLLVHDHDDPVGRQVAAARTSVGEQGPVLSARRSAGPIPAPKAVCWAVFGQLDGGYMPVRPQIW
jgi:hypothetical protein